MAISTPDAVPGEVIEAAWGDAVRADLTTIDTIARAAMPKAGGMFTGNVLHGGNVGAGPGILHETGGRIHSAVVGASYAGLPSLMLARASNPGAGAPGEHLIRFYRGISISLPFESAVGSVALNAGANGVVYNTTSDKRLKTLTRPVDPDEALAKVAAAEPVNFTWIDAPEVGEQTGFFAQDLYPIAPEVVSPGIGDPGDPGFVPWMVDHATLVPILVAAIQALTARITVLEEAATP